MGVQPSLRHIGKYEVIDVIGTGGMGIVFRAHDPAIGRTVAIKMLRQSDSAAGTDLYDRFFSREMKSTGNLHHKNIVTVYDSGEQDGNPYLVMEFLEGDALSKLIAERRPLPLVEKLDVVVQICDGLQYAHDRNIIHRDIKPANVILLADGTVKIVDFGVARVAGGESTIVQAGQLVGSLYYLSPEQINSLPIDGRSDIFSTGVLLYEFLTGELPFKGADPASTFVKILTEEPPPLSQFMREIPPAMQPVLSRALAKNANERFQTAEEFGFEILAVQKHLTASIVADCMKRAEAAMQRHDLERARVHLLEVVRLDRQHERANRLLRDVRKVIQQEQRSAQIVQMRSQAQVALAGGQYEEALACADQALKLDPADQLSIRLSQEIRTAISRAKAVRDALNRAESALFAGDFEEAKEAVEESLRLDPSDSEARALASVINKELSERSRRQRVQEFVDKARREIAERKFGEAVDALHHAEELDPADSNVRELLQWAERGQEQEKRRRYLQEITDQIEKALHNGDFSSACTISEMGLQRFADDPTLERLRSISEKQREIAERRRFVQDRSLAVKILNGQGRFAEAIEALSEALGKYPGEPNLESLLALTRNEAERLRQEREEAARREKLQRAEDEARARHIQQVLNASIDLRRSLDARAALDKISAGAAGLRRLIESADLDDHAKNAAAVVLEEVDARLRARERAVAELEQFRHHVAKVRNVASIADGNNRLRSIAATFPNEKQIQSACVEISKTLAHLREEHERRISLLTALAQGVDSTPTGELKALLQKAVELGTDFDDDADIGVLLQQIESSISDRLERQAAHLRDIESLFADLEGVRSLQELTRIVDRSKAIAALDRTDEELADRAGQLLSEGNRLRARLESTLTQMASLADRVMAAATIHDAEAILPSIRSLAEDQPHFQDLQEAATRLLAQVHGRRIEHDLIVQELESIRGTLTTLETDEDLSAAAARAAECRAQHRNDSTILALSAEIEASIHRILRERAALRERTAACNAAMRVAEECHRANDLDGALKALLAVEAQNPDRADLHQKIAAVQKQMEQLRIELRRPEQERIDREQLEAEARARAASSQRSLDEAQHCLAQGKPEDSIRIARTALDHDPSHQGLQATLQAAEAELARRRMETERRERDRIEKEKAEADRLERERAVRERAEAEAWARQAATEKAIAEARQLAIHGKWAESLPILRIALRSDPQNQQLLSEIDSVGGELARQRAEQERIEHERVARERAEAERKEQERLVKEKAEAERLAKAKAEAERLERERIERERLAREEAETERKERERLAKEKAEAERREEERVAKEKAAAEARARQGATEQAIQQARQSLIQHNEEESLAILLAAMERDPASASLRIALDSTRKEIARQQAERERLAKEKAERERKEQERLARERAAAEQKERERLAQEKAEAEKKEKERLAQEKAERERVAREKVKQERQDRERLAKEKAAAEAAPSIEPELSPVPTPFLRRPSIIIGSAAALLVLIAVLYFALRGSFAPSPLLQITITRNPADATLSVDGQPKDCPASCALQLAAGSHSIELQRSGYQTLHTSLVLAKADVNRVFPYVLTPTSPIPPSASPLPYASLSIIGDIGAASVSLDGKPAGELGAGRINLSQLAPGDHSILVSRGRKELRVSLRVAKDGSVTINNASGLDEDFVIGATHSANQVTLFCRCNGTELSIDGKRLRAVAHNVYRIPASHSQLTLTLLHGSLSQNVFLPAASPQQMTVMVGAPTLTQVHEKQQPPLPTTPPTAPAPDVAAWNQIKESNDLGVLRNFRNQYSSSPYAKDAAERMEAVAWNSVQNSTQISDFQQFLKDYPDGAHGSEARQHIAALQAKINAARPPATTTTAPTVKALTESSPATVANSQNTLTNSRMIQDTLHHLERAYSSKDVGGVCGVWPTCDRSRLRQVFKDAQSVSLSLRPIMEPNVSGDIATVQCTRRTATVYPRQKPIAIEQTVTIQLRKQDDGWHIESIK